MSKVNISNVVVLNNPSSFFDPFKFEVTFECYETINDDLEFKLIYVGSAESDENDQELDSVLVGPVLPEGRHMFVFEAGAPNPAKIPAAETVGVTVVLLTCSYRNQEFIKIGYFILNEYVDQELKENPPAEPKYDLLRRSIDVQHPRVTKVPIKWDDNQQQSVEKSLENENPVDSDMKSNDETAMIVADQKSPDKLAVTN